MSNKYYTGVGSRETPANVLSQMTDLSRYLQKKNYILRSGGAKGADSAFESGVDNSAMKEIYLPWRMFNRNYSELFSVGQEALDIAKTLHPIYKSLSRAAQLLHGRNVYQVLGADVSTPSVFLVCYTPCGAQIESELTRYSGGTATAIKLACRRHIPVFNLNRDGSLEKVYEFIMTLSANELLEQINHCE